MAGLTEIPLDGLDKATLIHWGFVWRLGSKYRLCVPQNRPQEWRKYRCGNERPMENNPQTQDKGKSKGGRPKLPDGKQRTHAVKVYFDDENYAKLLKRRKRTGKPLSSIVYELAVNGHVKEPLSKELASCVRAMASMSNNLNQLAHEAHISGYAAVEERTRELSDKIAKVLVRISHEQ